MSSRLIFVSMVVMVLALVAVGPIAAQDPGTKQIGLVIAFPGGASHQEVVTVTAAATTFEVLETAKVTLASQDTAFGPAVCGINGTGCPAADCFCDPEHYWAYYHLVEGSWVAAMEGAGTFIPEDRAVEGFAWSGFDANFNPTVQPPVYTFDQIVTNTTPPVAIPEPATLLLLGSGVAGLAAYARRRGQKA